MNLIPLLENLFNKNYYKKKDISIKPMPFNYYNYYTNSIIANSAESPRLTAVLMILV